MTRCTTRTPSRGGRPKRARKLSGGVTDGSRNSAARPSRAAEFLDPSVTPPDNFLALFGRPPRDGVRVVQRVILVPGVRLERALVGRRAADHPHQPARIEPRLDE